MDADTSRATEARANLLREAADDCEDVANELLNQAPMMGKTKERRYRKQAAATMVRACALRIWADIMEQSPEPRGQQFTLEEVEFIQLEMNSSLDCGAEHPLFQQVYDKAVLARAALTKE